MMTTGHIAFPGLHRLDLILGDYAPTIQIPRGVTAPLAVVVSPPGEAEGSGVLARLTYFGDGRANH